MVEKTTLHRKIEVRLKSLRGRIGALGDYAARFDPDGDDGRGADWIALEAEWRDTLDRLAWVHERFEQGELSPEQAVRHCQNLRLLKENESAVHHLDLARPRGAIAAWLAASSELAELA